MEEMDRVIGETINAFVNIFAENSRTRWKPPLIAFAKADDPLFAKLKEIVNPTHSLPGDFLEGAKTVITYFLPFQNTVIESNKRGRFSSRQWAGAYIETNRLINDLNRHLENELIGRGYRAAFVPATHNFDQRTLLSDWSHRSAAYIAGLGTFGLNHMLITSQGCCGRIGSLVTDLFVRPTPRYNRELCLYRAGGSCGRCARKCVNDALTVEGLDKQRCYRMCLENADRLSNLESIADVCGKCLVGVPCSTAAPESDSD